MKTAMTNPPTKTLRQLAGVLLAILLCCASGRTQESGAGTEPADYDHLVASALSLLGQGNLDQAQQTAKRAIKLEAKRYEAYAVAAKIASGQGAAGEAGDLVQKALELAPEESKDKVRQLAAMLAQRGPTTQTPAGTEKKDSAAANEVAVIKTSAGDMVIEFWPDAAPKTVENFKSLARKGFYDGTAFHRIIKGFMIQGGDPNTKDPAKEALWGSGDPGYKIKAEFNDHPHRRGVISMARSQHPDSAGSQFFICDGDAPFLDHKYTAFGRLIKGDNVLGKIADTPVTVSGTGERRKPTTRVEVQTIKIVPADSVK